MTFIRNGNLSHEVLERGFGNTCFAEREQVRSRAADLDELAFVETEASEQWKAVVDELLRLRGLEDDWDGEGAVAPLASIVDGAITLASWMKSEAWSIPARISASVNGAVVFEWYAPVGYIEIEVLSPAEAEVHWIPDGSSVAQTFRLTFC